MKRKEKRWKREGVYHKVQRRNEQPKRNALVDDHQHNRGTPCWTRIQCCQCIAILKQVTAVGPAQQLPCSESGIPCQTQSCECTDFILAGTLVTESFANEGEFALPFDTAAQQGNFWGAIPLSRRDLPVHCGGVWDSQGEDIEHRERVDPCKFLWLPHGVHDLDGDRVPADHLPFQFQCLPDGGHLENNSIAIAEEQSWWMPHPPNANSRSAGPARTSAPTYSELNCPISSQDSTN